jgi:CelD/BcsL family acetyltransferase involved in cellulose biosynthesis
MTTMSHRAVVAARPSALLAQPVDFEDVPRATWDALAAETVAVTPFSRWTFHRAWWDAYGSTAHPQYLACVEPGSSDPTRIRAIVPLMHRHVVEPGDASSATILRGPSQGGTRIRPDAKAVYMAASYHADYASVLAAEADLPDAAAATAEALAGPPDIRHGSLPWDAVDLRRLRAADPARHDLEAAFRQRAATHGWEVHAEVEDVCPVITLRTRDWDEYLAMLGKKERHEIRRKLRRAEAAGTLTFQQRELSPEAVDEFIDLHQARWGERGLFPDNEGGARSRRFIHRLAELEREQGNEAQLQLGFVYVGDRLIFAGVAFDDGETCYFYNAGMDPEARELSPGVTGTACYLRDRLAAGRRRFDFMRGSEPYKYEWGAVDETVHRLLVTRTR